MYVVHRDFTLDGVKYRRGQTLTEIEARKAVAHHLFRLYVSRVRAPEPPKKPRRDSIAEE